MLLTEMYAPDGRLLAAGLSRSDSEIATAPSVALPLHALIERPVDALVVLEESLAGAFDKSLDTLWQEVPPGESTFIVLVPRRDPPRIDPYYSKQVSSFLSDLGLFGEFLPFRLHPSTHEPL